MLEPAPMLRLTAVLLDGDERAALQALGELGLLQPIALRAGPETAPLPPRSADGAPAWDAVLERVERVRAALGSRCAAAPAAEGSPEAVERGLHAVEERARELVERRQALRRRGQELSALVGRLASYSGLGIPLARLGTGPALTLRLGTVPLDALEPLRRQAGGALVLPLSPRRGSARRPLVILAAARSARSLEPALREAGFEDEPLPADGEGTLDELAGRLTREADGNGEEARLLDEALRAFSEEAAPVLSRTAARARLERTLLEVRACFPRTERAILIQGWIPATASRNVEQKLRAAAGGRCAVEAGAPSREDEEHVPVLLRSAALLRPFEQLVAGFGLPRYRELSPAPFLAVSWLLMFGVMFGDVGHGAVLAVAGLAVLLAGRWRDAGLLLLLGGLASMLAGAVYGNWFGLERLRPLALWRDPLEGDPIHLMSATVGLGVAGISVGLALNVANRLRERDLLGAVMGRFGLAGLLFYWGALALLLRGGSAPLPWAAGLLIVPVAAWVLEGPVRRARGGGHGAPREGIAGALVEAFETMLVYLANTISFVRLAAYAMSHAALLLAVAMLVRAVARPDGAAGAASWLVAVVGNGVAIALESIVASVQALRLEYYELFSKFLSGAGRPFRPFRLSPGLPGGGA